MLQIDITSSNASSTLDEISEFSRSSVAVARETKRGKSESTKEKDQKMSI